MNSQLPNLNKHRTVKVQRTIDETSTVKTILFNDTLCSKAKPGQFVMVWIPGLDEIPMSVSHIGNKFVGISVKKVGEATEAIFKLKENSEFGLRGPYGNSFKILKGRILIVGGGVGMAPLKPLIVKLGRDKPTVLMGAATSDELLFFKQLKERLNENLIVTTEDGSKGLKGLVSDILPKLLEKKSFKCIYACGPELMLKRTLEIASKFKVQAQVSLERYIKCGLGLCGSCMINGLRVCKDGPIFSIDSLKSVKDFGFHRLDPSGRKIPIQK